MLEDVLRMYVSPDQTDKDTNLSCTEFAITIQTLKAQDQLPSCSTIVHSYGHNRYLPISLVPNIQMNSGAERKEFRSEHAALHHDIYKARMVHRVATNKHLLARTVFQLKA